MDNNEMMIAMKNWQDRMLALADKPACTQQWWDEVADSLEFMPKEARAAFVQSFVESCVQG